MAQRIERATSAEELDGILIEIEGLLDLAMAKREEICEKVVQLHVVAERERE